MAAPKRVIQRPKRDGLEIRVYRRAAHGREALNKSVVISPEQIRPFLTSPVNQEALGLRSRKQSVSTSN